MRLTKQEFFDRLGPAAVGNILTMAKQFVEVEAWVKRLDLVTPDPDGTSVDLGDPRTVAGVHAIGAILVQSGVVPAGWVEDVLHIPEPTPPAEAPVFVATHTVQDLGLAMVDVDGTVRLADGRWTTLEALSSMDKAVEVLNGD